MTALTSLTHLELVNVLSVPNYQLVMDGEIPSSYGIIHKSAIPKIPSMGLNQGGSNVMARGPEIDIGNQSNFAAELIADLVESHLKRAAHILLMSSSDPRLETTRYISNISEKYMGINKDLETSKRDVAKYILSLDRDFGSVYFLLPNGDVYLGEPYSGQIQLPRLNFADRDWYKGIFVITNNVSREHNALNYSPKNNTLTSNGTATPLYYVSAVFQSAAIHVPAIGIAVPVYDNSIHTTVGLDRNNVSEFRSSSPDNSLDTTIGTVSGYWVGVLNMNETRSYIHHLNLTSQNHRVVVVDHNGTAIIDSLQNETPKREVNILNGNSPSNETKLIDLQSIKRALNGETGSIVENVNGTRTIVGYHPIEAYPHKWAAIVMEFDRDKP